MMQTAANYLELILLLAPLMNSSSLWLLCLQAQLSSTHSWPSANVTSPSTTSSSTQLTPSLSQRFHQPVMAQQPALWLTHQREPLL
jgi:hypothetical protein